ncbi:hypothetical protein PF005_g12229 [Phytophthora fragariae]|uniref:PX domain-containing protein n=1 Tax=Phytophthora fragariae TaxID=53985 RepID=A0A6A3Z1D7_9STRA|nr:hypothetical protein PF003_g23721 [Phytophthora fragariae]KAE8936709.1 hypothetical protein PF009_g13370 [Phytophthora fragariae]KAE9007308.1 hypothetical protein PF011_g11180 [Phytophthora fragariae]KAE9108941.1 hypothetical protein PF010_g11723 [Phytophthora fragariae]KAE9108985.1 hypothetical protein PF007_g12436 [Phytophthora fragariae]
MTSVVHTTSSSPLATHVVVGGLARLTPMNLRPERYSRHMQTVAKLKQIRRALVTPTNGSYAIDVFTPSQSTTRIPTSLKAASKGQRPDVHIEKQFSDFVCLRDELYETCKAAHPTMDCQFCSEVARTLLLGAVLPGSVLTFVLSRNQHTRALQRFIDALLLLVAACPVIEADACPCQKKLPRHLFKFLFGELDPLA